MTTLTSRIQRPWLVGAVVCVDLLVLIAHVRLGRRLGLPAGNLWGVLGLLVLLFNGLCVAYLRAPREDDPLTRGLQFLLRARISDRVYGVLLGGLLVIAASYRVWATASLGCPTTCPDTQIYVGTALLHPWLPISQMRTVGFPAVCSLALNGLGHPVWILIVHNLLWLGSSLLLVLGLRLRLDQGLASLLVLAYLCFVDKNLEFEYMLMSEHLSRTLATLALGVLVLTWGRLSWRQTLTFAALVVLATLVKPTGIVLLPLGWLALLATRVLQRAPWREVFKHGGCSTAIVVAAVVSYACVYESSHGRFGLTDFTYTAVYSQVGHLTDLDALPEHPQLMRGLNRVLPPYVEGYASEGRYRPNWLVFGESDEALRRDLGPLSPAHLVAEEAKRADPSALGLPPGASAQQRQEAIFKKLSTSAIKAHPVRYLLLAGSDFVRFFRSGLTGSYGGNGVSVLQLLERAPTALAVHEAGVDRCVRSTYVATGRTAPRLSELLGPVHEGGEPGLVPRSAHVVIRSVSYLVDDGVRYAWVLLLGLPLLWIRRASVPAPPLLLALVSLLGVVGYATLLSLICMSEVQRLAANMQDYAAVSAILLGVMELRLVLALTLETGAARAPTNDPVSPLEASVQPDSEDPGIPHSS